MLTDFYFKVLIPCLFGVMALFCFVVGLRGIVSKKPFLISAQWLVASSCWHLHPASCNRSSFQCRDLAMIPECLPFSTG